MKRMLMKWKLDWWKNSLCRSWIHKRILSYTCRSLIEERTLLKWKPMDWWKNYLFTRSWIDERILGQVYIEASWIEEKILAYRYMSWIEFSSLLEGYSPGNNDIVLKQLSGDIVQGDDCPGQLSVDIVQREIVREKIVRGILSEEQLSGYIVLFTHFNRSRTRQPSSLIACMRISFSTCISYYYSHISTPVYIYELRTIESITIGLYAAQRRVYREWGSIGANVFGPLNRDRGL